MAVKKNRYYTVWVGVEPGVYDSWTDCQLQIKGYPGARYKSFATREEAVEAYRGNPSDQLDIMRSILREADRRRRMALPVIDGHTDYSSVPDIRLDAIAVDGACSGNPGRMEYRAVRVIDGAEVFRVGAVTPLIGTNNIAEYLAMIHLAALLEKAGDTRTPIYTDSRNTFAWLRRGGSHTSLAANVDTQPTLELLRRADLWLKEHGPVRNPILKWKTDEWGEIPADFGRK
ncbi:MAG: ribonuclease H family protein [Muribaculaceae bacterium]|nr:ribonuclease H family protein [Muribaculaceae bacterium]